MKAPTATTDRRSRPHRGQDTTTRRASTATDPYAATRFDERSSSGRWPNTAPAIDDRITRPSIDAPWPTAPITADVADCDCPDFCERDHDND